MPLIISGGHAIKYWSSLTLDLRKRSIGPSDLITKEEGVKICATVKKNHCTPNVYPYKKVEYYAIFGEGIEQILTSLELAADLGVIEQKGAWIYWKDEKGENINSWQGKAAFRTYMKNNPEEFKRFMDMIDPMAGVKELAEEEIEAIHRDEAALEQTEKKTKKGKKA